MEKDNNMLYIVAILAVVAIVGIVVLVLNANKPSDTTYTPATVLDDEGNVVGQAIMCAGRGCLGYDEYAARGKRILSR